MTSATISANIQLNTIGPLDQFLFGSNPESDLSLFTYDVSRIGSFAKNIVPIIYNETVDFGNTFTATIDYIGDFVNGIQLYFKLPALSIPPGSTFVGWTNTIGYAMIKNVQILIGEYIISQQTGQMMEALDYLSIDASERLAHDIRIGRYDNVNVLSSNAKQSQDIYVPLQFWFNKKINSSLPLVALGKQQVKIRITLNDFESCVTYDGPTPPTVASFIQANILADYYMITKEEKDYYLHNQLVYLIEEYQEDSSHLINSNFASGLFNVNMLKSMKELVIVAREIESENNNDFFNYGLRDHTRPGQELIKTIKFYTNGLTRFEQLDESYYRLVTPQKSHTFSGNRNIYVLPFAEKPEILQPTGSMNFSIYSTGQLTGVQLGLTFTRNLPNCRLIIYGVSQNVLTIQNGVAQVMFLT
jgi:hypothetical protein